MAQHTESQFYIKVESFLPPHRENIKGNVEIRPVAGERYPQSMRVECMRGMSEDHPLGTRFRITAEIRDDLNGLGEYLVMPKATAYEVMY